ncbi:polysaccharide lyase [Pontibacter sp. HSC-14F20]|uniref:polysaccharide lyase n=1 Tax=Pontibacter sp. HSC-14F20 TaxID=2864136 RepID=UPI001C73A0EF|nr:polysaccharide lyase [Pontibacter sp. HSC-14F20]MBX0332359.1 polysaccharide lyase [Pontibacter sp. HSC-14F20]
MKLRFRNMMLPMLAGALAFSCEKKEMEELSPSAALSAEASQNATANHIFEETFEGSKAFSGRHTQFASTSYSFQMATNPVFRGAKSGRFELRSSDTQVANGTRAEVIVADPATNKDRWYSFAAYFPAKDYASDSGSELISQWWQTSGSTQATSLRVRQDRLILRTGNNASSLKEIDLGKITKDSWQEYVFHFIHSYGSDGLIEIWRNGTKILTHKGGNMYDTKMPNWKIGIYRASWNSGSTSTTKRVLYFDNIRVGNERASFNEMSSSGSNTTAPVETPTAPTEPTPSPSPSPETNPIGSVPATGAHSVILVDAGTEKDVMTVKNGATLSFSELRTRKFNFRSNVDPTTVGSVKFELKGAMNRTYTDNAAPYALFGDDGRGNYYFGNTAMSTGSYTLTVTPYSGSNGSGTAGTPVTVSFNIVESGSGSTAETSPVAPAPTPSGPVTTPPSTSTSSQISSLTLVDAHTEKDVMQLANGASLSFSALGTKKFNFRADLKSGVGSVKFELKGAMNRSYTDNAAPHALFGDDGRGNYYYGNLTMPAGTYTLTATPYSGSNGSGTAGTPVTYSFTVKN